MKFTKKKIQGLMHTEVHFTLDAIVPGEECAFSIVATVEGLSFRGRSPWLDVRGDLQALAKTISDAVTESLALKKCQIHTPS